MHQRLHRADPFFLANQGNFSAKLSRLEDPNTNGPNKVRNTLFSI